VTADLDAVVREMGLAQGAIPATLGYRGYTHSCCISINHVVCHGIPSDRTLRDGDIVNIDVTPLLDGWHGDSSRMYLVGERVSLRARKLVDVTYDAMMRGIAAIRPGATLGDLGHAIQSFVEAHRFSVVRDFCGHGTGKIFHEAPSVVHYGRPGQGLVFKPAMIFTVEPMVNVGRHEVKILDDGWTAVTRDKSLSAQFEHTVGVTDTGVEIFTLSPAGFTKPPYSAPA
jgi:methionyl aminopeptidase